MRRPAVIGLGNGLLREEYLLAVVEMDKFAVAKTAEAESQALLIDRSKWAAAGVEKTKAALASAGLAITAPVKTVAELEKFVDEKISNLDERANAAKL